MKNTRWSVVPRDDFYIYADDEAVAKCFGGDEARANLIAAAPELLAACETLKADCEAALSGDWDKSDEGFKDSLAILNRAIKRAKKE